MSTDAATIDLSGPLQADEEAMERLRRLLDIPDRPVQKPAEYPLATSFLALALVAFVAQDPYGYSVGFQTFLSFTSAGIAAVSVVLSFQQRRSHKYTLTATLIGLVSFACAVALLSSLLG